MNTKSNNFFQQSVDLLINNDVSNILRIIFYQTKHWLLFINCIGSNEPNDNEAENSTLLNPKDTLAQGIFVMHGF